MSETASGGSGGRPALGRRRRVLGALTALAGLAIFGYSLPHQENCGPAYDHLCTTADDLATVGLIAGIILFIAGLVAWRSKPGARSASPRAQRQAAAGGHDASVAGQLSQLAELHRTGALDDAEFEAAKARLLGGAV